MGQRKTAACIFCGGLPLTNEDVIPRWLSRRYEKVPTPRTGHVKGAPLGGSTYGLFLQVRKIVCASCNNGWMSRLQSEVKPGLEAMMDDAGPLALAPSAQATVVAWLTMTAMVHEWSDDRFDPPVYSAEERRAFALEEQVPERTTACIARRATIGPPATGVGFHSNHIRLGPNPDRRLNPQIGHLFSMVSGHLLARLIFVRPGESAPRPVVEQMIRRTDRPWTGRGGARSLPRRTVVGWPPVRPLTTEGEVLGFLDPLRAFGLALPEP